jgi:hypothetical protein
MTREAPGGDSGNPPTNTAFAREHRLEKGMINWNKI